MSEKLWWYVARSGGIVALLLAAAAVIWGLLLSSGLFHRRPPKRWLLGMHSWLGGLTVTFTAIHVLGLWLDSYVQYSLADLSVPFVATEAPGRWPIAWGIIAMYLLVSVQATSVLRKRLPRQWWRAVHMASFGVLVAGIVHGANAGTDTSNRAYVVGLFAAALIGVYLGVFRVLTRRRVLNG